MGRARGKYKIACAGRSPATLNSSASFRVQMNTLEQLVAFLPAMWIYAVFLSDAVGGRDRLGGVGRRPHHLRDRLLSRRGKARSRLCISTLRTVARILWMISVVRA